MTSGWYKTILIFALVQSGSGKTFPDRHKMVEMVFNRYSQKIFESKGNSNGWDGTFKGQPQPVGAYIYILDPGEPGMKPIKGTVMIIR